MPKVLSVEQLQKGAPNVLLVENQNFPTEKPFADKQLLGEVLRLKENGAAPDDALTMRRIEEIGRFCAEPVRDDMNLPSRLVAIKVSF